MNLELSVLAPVRRAVLGTFAGVFLLLGVSHCSSGGSTGSGTGSVSSASSACESVCSCVASQNGDRTQCLSQCNGIAATSHDLKNDCEDELKSRGYSSCQDTCDAFSKASSGSETGGGSGTATLGDFCEKCAGCVGDSSFEEGFCEPFKTSGGGFDVAACTANGSRSELANPSISASELSGLSCSGFDAAE